MIGKSFLIKIFSAASMQRWNDKARLVEMRELDKQAHKMIIAFILGKFEEEKGNKEFDWIEVIEGSIFDYLKKIYLTDLKPQVFNKIKADPSAYNKLMEWVYTQVEKVLSPIDSMLSDKLKKHLLETRENINRRIINAAHSYSTNWEFSIIYHSYPYGYDMANIRNRLQKKMEEYSDLDGIRQLALFSDLKNFVNLCGELRFQDRWSHLHMVPRTSVLGHMLIVAILSYIFSFKLKACPKRRYNNYFTGLFHDLPEILTRDIIDPVKKSVAGLDNLIKEYEKKEMEEKIFGLIPKKWHNDMKMFTEDEFRDVVTVNGMEITKKSSEISSKYNKDRFNPKDGSLIQASDHLTAYIESYLSQKNGISSTELVEARSFLKAKYRGKSISGINISDIYTDLDRA
jgi:putative hydrolase of HD superfamily